MSGGAALAEEGAPPAKEGFLKSFLKGFLSDEPSSDEEEALVEEAAPAMEEEAPVEEQKTTVAEVNSPVEQQVRSLSEMAEKMRACGSDVNCMNRVNQDYMKVYNKRK